MKTRGIVRLNGAPGIPASVAVEDRRLSIDSRELSGAWSVPELRVRALHEGFVIRVDDIEIILKVDDEVGVAEGLGIAAATPRLARKMAARHNTVEAPPPVEAAPIRSQLGALGFALAGAVVLVGGALLIGAPGVASGFWVIFVFGGLVMVTAAYLMTAGRWWGTLAALVSMGGVTVGFGFLVSETGPNSSIMPVFVFVAAGLSIGASILFSESVRATD